MDVVEGDDSMDVVDDTADESIDDDGVTNGTSIAGLAAVDSITSFLEEEEDGAPGDDDDDRVGTVTAGRF